MQNITKERLYWIDLIKALCILFIFWKHCSNFYGVYVWDLNKFYIPFYVNAFFFITGYFLLKKQLSEPLVNEDTTTYIRNGGKKYLSNLLLTLVLPCIFFASVFYLPKVILGREPFSIIGIVNDTIGGGTYWFVSALVVAYLILFIPLVLRIKNIWVYYMIACACAIAGYYLGRMGEQQWTLWSYRQGMVAMIYIVSGGVYARYEEVISKYIGGIASLLLFGFFIYSIFWLRPLTLTSMCHINVLGYFTVIASILVLFYVCRRMPECRILSFIGENSILFYFFSGGFPLIAAIAVRKFIPYHNVMSLCLVFVLSLIMAYALAYIIKRYFPYLKDFRKLKNI